MRDRAGAAVRVHEEVHQRVRGGEAPARLLAALERRVAGGQEPHQLRRRLGLFGCRHDVAPLVSPGRVDDALPRELRAGVLRVVRVHDLDAYRRSVVPTGVGEPVVREIAVLGDLPVGADDELHAELALDQYAHGGPGAPRDGLVQDELVHGPTHTRLALEAHDLGIAEVADAQGRSFDITPTNDESVSALGHRSTSSSRGVGGCSLAGASIFIPRANHRSFASVVSGLARDAGACPS